MSQKQLYLSLAMPVPLPQLFDYLPPQDSSTDDLEKLCAGIRVKASFGNRALIGVLIAVKTHTDTDPDKLKHADEILDSSPCLPETLINTCRWASSYYHHPLGEVISAALPKRYRDGEPIEKTVEPVWALTTDGKGLPFDALKRSKKQQALLQYLLKNNAASQAQCKTLEVSSATLKTMKDKGLITQHYVQPQPGSAPETILKETPKTLNDQQQLVFENIRHHQFQCSLIEGVTGSGKTEVYMQVIARTLQTGKQALVLIPEIGLTPQTLRRFHQRFNVEIAELHSRVSEVERARNWQKAREGIARIIIGTRLAALAPSSELGIIIIDEEHDTSYKQQDGFRYSARDLSIYRASQEKIPVILGSATPSLESLQNALCGRYQHLKLSQRAGQASMPAMQTLDMRNQTLQSGLTTDALTSIKQTIDSGLQALVFLNRRGYAPLLYCHVCGWNARCPSCDLNYTLHHNPRHLHCHHCDQQRAAPNHCPACQHTQLAYSGTGTEQTWEALQKLFPDVPVIRIDRDTTRGKHDMDKALEEINKGQACILVGTQMLAKGHHLKALNLVVISNTDQGLMSPDFKSIEKMGQLIIQVAGRAGRGEQPGRVLLQSYQPEHPHLQLLINYGYHAFALELLNMRKQAALPPFAHSALLRAESKREENAIELLQLAKKVARGPNHRQNITAIGPLPGFIEKVNHRYRFQLQLTCANRGNLHQCIDDILTVFSRNALSKRTRWSLDVDPAEY